MAEVIDDLVILGRAVPERLKDGRTTVCLGGWSAKRGFIRIYPTRLKMALRRWDVIRVEVERNERDTREESWKIVGSGPNWETLSQRVERVGRIDEPYERRQIVLNNTSGCVMEINDAKRSLGIIRPKEIVQTYFGENPQYGQPMQLSLFTEDAEEWAAIKQKYPREPRIRYICSDCRATQGYHDQKVLEWGFYEWMRKAPGKEEQVWENAGFYSDKHEIFLFVGNQANQRTSFLIISVLRIQRDPKPPKPQDPEQQRLF